MEMNDLRKIDTDLAARAHTLGIRYASPIPAALLPLGQILKNRCLNSRCNIRSALAILADGTITTCGMGRYVDDFRYGELGKDNVAETWVNHPTLRTIREKVPRELSGVCGRCVFRDSCFGRCRILNENVTLDSLCEPFWFCAEMESRGLFPDTRIIEREHGGTAAALAPEQ